MSIWIGIDGGGSNLRVVGVDDDMHVIVQAMRGTVNPSAIGRDASAALMQDALREVLATIPGASVAGVGMGVAGASAVYAGDWLRAVIAAVLPDTPVAPSSDNEIALVGAHGERRGVLLLAGTGSVAFGVNDAGESVQTGGWGYLLGDEGGGYWLGNQALRAVTLSADGIAPDAAPLSQRLLVHLGMSSATDAITWVYRQPPPTRDIATLASVVLEMADAGDAYTCAIIEQGAAALVLLSDTIVARLHMTAPRIAFAGGLLTSDNSLSRAVCRRLGMTTLPEARYAPVVGAALLAKLHYGELPSR
ncbi:MAG: BadF/BadG/BcrA/BcrD ATPase family protein [Chloroflexota bacterium]|nr:BadF/BadG/BcrA/BcrD ATPase family protein [Chloroflexota bacterium]